jgi:hypothetical protein
MKLVCVGPTFERRVVSNDWISHFWEVYSPKTFVLMIKNENSETSPRIKIPEQLQPAFAGVVLPDSGICTLIPEKASGT